MTARGEWTPARAEARERHKDMGGSLDQQERVYQAIRNLPVDRRRPALTWFKRNGHKMTKARMEVWIKQLEAGAES